MRIATRAALAAVLLVPAVAALGQEPRPAAEPPKLERKISMKRARQAALRAAPGRVTSGELEYERKLWVYSFDIKGRDGKMHEVQVDAKTGALAGQTIETPADEAAEKKKDARERKAAGAKP